MYQGKHNNSSGRAPRRPRSRRTLLAALALVLVLGLAIGGTIAYLFANTEAITNTFTPGSTTPEIEEKVDNGTKKSIVIKNTGNVEAYIRVMLVGNELDDDGNVKSSFTPSFTLNETDWIKIGDYYYYRTPVSGSGTTNDLLSNGSTITVSENQTVTVLAQSIQSVPASAVEAAWTAVEVKDGQLTAKEVNA